MQKLKMPRVTYINLLVESGWKMCDVTGYARECLVTAGLVAARVRMSDRQFDRWWKAGLVPSPEKIAEELEEIIDVVVLTHESFPNRPLYFAYDDSPTMYEWIEAELDGEFENADLGDPGDEMKVLTLSLTRMKRQELDLLPEWKGW
jgi:hypothetical protein